MGHDQLFKELLREFFEDFVRLFYPDVAARTDFSRVMFLDREVFTDFPEGEARRSDFVAEAYTVDGEPENFLFHIETEIDPKADFPWRMLEYFMLLRLRFKRPILPIALFPTRGAHGETRGSYWEGLFGRDILRFEYSVLSLPDLSPGRFLSLNNPLAAALSAAMRQRLGKRLSFKQEAMRTILASEVNEAQRNLLLTVAGRYNELDEGEQLELDERLAQEKVGGSTMAIDLREISKELSLEHARVVGKCEALLRILRDRFGELPPDVVESIRSINYDHEVDPLIDRAVTAATLNDVGIPEF